MWEAVRLWLAAAACATIAVTSLQGRGQPPGLFPDVSRCLPSHVSTHASSLAPTRPPCATVRPLQNHIVACSPTFSHRLPHVYKQPDEYQVGRRRCCSACWCRTAAGAAHTCGAAAHASAAAPATAHAQALPAALLPLALAPLPTAPTRTRPPLCSPTATRPPARRTSPCPLLTWALAAAATGAWCVRKAAQGARVRARVGRRRQCGVWAGGTVLLLAWVPCHVVSRAPRSQPPSLSDALRPRPPSLPRPRLLPAGPVVCVPADQDHLVGAAAQLRLPDDRPGELPAHKEVT